MRIIRGKYGRRRFNVPTNITARPTTDFARENIFNIIENLIDIEGIRALDLFAGTGAITFELLSRGAASVTAVEKASTQSRFIEATAKTLGEQNLRLIRGDVFRFLQASQPNSYDFIFADPPYDLTNFSEVLGLVLEKNLLKAGGIFILEHSKKYDFSQLEHFKRHVAYGSVNFSIFQAEE
ncbi:MAG: 16S rRNA (guanine(966)-N(2))-methyltransferase RsmD [Bacteroides sp.]|nr:16S rRNA (guanine(966)-N(2))-methyltransferase RsmD [Bacteroides sp.]MCM1478046.1 16S rRNA (guanine(966)-N(2))-methyltransferase RsmD [Bacteroides sp.]